MTAVANRRHFTTAPDGAYETTLRGQDILEAPFLNKGSAFTLEERAALGLDGLLPTAVTTIEQQAERSYAQYRHQGDDLAKQLFLAALHDRNEVLYFLVLRDILRDAADRLHADDRRGDPAVQQGIPPPRGALSCPSTMRNGSTLPSTTWAPARTTST